MAKRIMAVAWLVAMAVAGVAAQPPAGGGGKQAKAGTVADVVRANKWTLVSISTRKGLISLCEGGYAGNPGAAFRLIYTAAGCEPGGLCVSDLPVADAAVSLDGNPAQLADLKPDMAVSVQLAKDAVRVTKIEATSKQDFTRPSVWNVTAVDPKKKTVTATCAALGLTLTDLAVLDTTRATEVVPFLPNVAPSSRPLDLATLTAGASVGLDFRFDAKAGAFVLGSILTVTSK